MTKLQKLVNQFLADPTEARFDEVRSLLEAFDYEEKRSKGSHHVFENKTGSVITVPKKGGQRVKRIYLKRLVVLLDLANWEE
jgi:predicted RNA binding protein YcfA (HicA-like mRNA interferase family)